MILVRFRTGVSPYQAGEEAGFEDAQAHALVAKGLAEYVDQADTPAPPEPEPEPEPEPGPPPEVLSMLSEVDRNVEGFQVPLELRGEEPKNEQEPEPEAPKARNRKR